MPLACYQAIPWHGQGYPAKNSRMTEFETFPGRLVAAARVAAGMTTRELAEAASVSRDTITRAEAADEVTISPKQRHGCIARPVWDRIVAALLIRGVELVPATEDHGPGVRLAATRPG